MLRGAPEYLSIQQLSDRTPWSPAAIRRMITRRVFVRGRHYFQPSGEGGKILFYWSAVEELIRNQEAGRRRGHRTEIDVDRIKEEARALLR